MLKKSNFLGKIQIYYMTQFQQEYIQEKNNYTFT